MSQLLRAKASILISTGDGGVAFEHGCVGERINCTEVEEAVAASNIQCHL